MANLPIMAPVILISTGKLTGNSDNDDVGANAVVLSATDGTTAVTQSFTVTVATSTVSVQFHQWNNC